MKWMDKWSNELKLGCLKSNDSETARNTIAIQYRWNLRMVYCSFLYFYSKLLFSSNYWVQKNHGFRCSNSIYWDQQNYDFGKVEVLVEMMWWVNCISASFFVILDLLCRVYIDGSNLMVQVLNTKPKTKPIALNRKPPFWSCMKTNEHVLDLAWGPSYGHKRSRIERLRRQALHYHR